MYKQYKLNFKQLEKLLVDARVLASEQRNTLIADNITRAEEGNYVRKLTPLSSLIEAMVGDQVKQIFVGISTDATVLASIFEPVLARMVQECTLTRVEGKISSKALILDYLVKDAEFNALYHLMRLGSRSLFINKQTLTPNYCALVPVIMSAFKRYANIAYSEWAEIDTLVEKNLADAMLYTLYKELTVDEILGTRQEGLRVKTGAKTGSFRPVESTFALYIPKNMVMGDYPKLAQIMYCQTWCASPGLRNKYMVLDPVAWDAMPAPLITSNALTNPIQDSKILHSAELMPWD